MNNRTYLLPGFRDWTFKTSDASCGLYPPTSDPAFSVTADTPVLEISSYVENILWLKFRMQGDAAKTAAKAIYSFDWQAMVREAGTDVQHQSPSLPGWTLTISDLGSGLSHISGIGIQLTADTPMQEIADCVRHAMQHGATPEETEAAVHEVMRIDFRSLILNAWAPRAALLLDGFTANNTALIESICANVMMLATLQKSDSIALGNEICVQVKTFS